MNQNTWTSQIGEKLIDLCVRTDQIDRLYHALPKLVLLLSIDCEAADDLLRPLYKKGGREPIRPALMLRAFFGWLLFGVKGITDWCSQLRSDAFYAVACGFEPGVTPGIGTFYDFAARLENAGIDFGKRDLKPSQQRITTVKSPRKRVKKHAEPKLSKKDRRLLQEKKRRQKQEKDQNSQVAERLAAQLMEQASIPRPASFQQILTDLLCRLAILPSLHNGLLPKNASICGDGSKLETRASPKGAPTCQCRQNKIYHCECPRRYRDPEADWGYDHYRDRFIYGHTFYQLTCSQNGHDLPLAIVMGPANESDYTLSLKAIMEFHKALEEHGRPLTVTEIVLDAGHDAVAVHRFCTGLGWEPFIDIRNSAQVISTKNGQITINDRGAPVCPHGREMRFHVHGKSRNVSVFCCPAKKPTRKDNRYTYTFRPEVCPLKKDCMPESNLGPFIYIKNQDDPRLFPRTPRCTQRYKDMMNLRSGSERSNGIKKEVYRLSRRHFSRSMYQLSLHAAAVLEHAAAWSKHAAANGIDYRILLDEKLAGMKKAA